MAQRDSDAFSVYSFEVTPEMKFISGLSEDPIQEEEELSNESGSRRGSSPKKDQESSAEHGLGNGSPGRKSPTGNGSSQKHSNGSQKMIQAGKAASPAENGRPSPTSSSNSAKSKTCILM